MNGQQRWTLYPRHRERKFITLVALLNETNTAFTDFYVMPNMSKSTEYQIRGFSDPWLQQGIRLSRLNDLCRVVTTIAMAKATIAP